MEMHPWPGPTVPTCTTPPLPYSYTPVITYICQVDLTTITLRNEEVHVNHACVQVLSKCADPVLTPGRNRKLFHICFLACLRFGMRRAWRNTALLTVCSTLPCIEPPLFSTAVRGDSKHYRVTLGMIQLHSFSTVETILQKRLPGKDRPTHPTGQLGNYWEVPG